MEGPVDVIVYCVCVCVCAGEYVGETDENFHTEMVHNNNARCIINERRCRRRRVKGRFFLSREKKKKGKKINRTVRTRNTRVITYYYYT